MILIPVWNGVQPALVPAILLVTMELAQAIKDLNGIVQEAVVHTAATMIQAADADIHAIHWVAMTMMYGI